MIRLLFDFLYNLHHFKSKNNYSFSALYFLHKNKFIIN